MKTIRFTRSYLTINLAVLCMLIANQACFAKVRYGINAVQGNYWSARGDFVDMFVNASPWSCYGGPGGGVPVTANGYPTSSPSGAACCLFSPSGYQSGPCNFYGEGAFTLQIIGPPFTLMPGTLQKTGNVTTCQFTLTAPAPSFSTQAPWCALVISNLDANNPPNNMHLTCPGYPAYPNNPTFTNQFLAAETPFSIVRGMSDYPATLQNPPFLAETNWSTRENPNYWGTSGQSFETTIAYCNATMTDLWIMYPPNGTDDFSVNLATLLHNTLNPKLHVYIEYCNEVWNFDYPEWIPNHNAGLANPALDDNHGSWGRDAEQLAYSLMKIRTAMQPILGSQGRFIIMGQMGGMPWTCAAGLDWINRNYGPPSNYIYGIGAAAYINTDSSYTDLPSLFASMTDYLNTVIVPDLQQIRTLANQYPGLKMVMYEGGQGLQSNGSDFSFLLSAQLDPGMAALYATEGAALDANGVDEMVWTNDCQTWDTSGFWGNVTDMRECAAGTSPRYNECLILAKAGVQSPARSGGSGGSSGGGSAPPNTHNLEAQPHAHNVAMPAPQAKMMTKQQMAAWAAQLNAKNAAKAQAAAAAKAAKKK
jgi:hypothetical protein